MAALASARVPHHPPRLQLEVGLCVKREARLLVTEAELLGERVAVKRLDRDRVLVPERPAAELQDPVPGLGDLLQGRSVAVFKFLSPLRQRRRMTDLERAVEAASVEN